MLASQTFLTSEGLARALEIGSYANDRLVGLGAPPSPPEVAEPATPDADRFPLRLSESGMWMKRGDTDERLDDVPQALTRDLEGDELTPFTVLRDRAKYQPKLLIQGVMPVPQGEISILYGDGGVGKSGLSQHFGVCAAAGVDFLGAPVGPCPVYYVDLENRSERTLQRLAGIAAKLDVSDHLLDQNLHIIARADKVLSDLLDPLHRHIANHGPGLAIIDNWMQAFAHDTVSPEQVMLAYKQLNSLTVRGCSVLILGHISLGEMRLAKRQGRLPEPAGNRQVYNGCRALYYMDKTHLYPRERNYEVSTEKVPLLRVGTDDAPVFAVGKPQDHASKTISLPLAHLDPPYWGTLPLEAVEDGRAVMAVLRHCHELAKQDLDREVGLAVGLGAERARKRLSDAGTLDSLVEQGLIVRFQDERDGRVFRYRLA